MTNYINDNGQAEVPPRWWLKQLQRFDDQLVVMPSRQRPGAYILARKARLSKGLNPIVKWMRSEKEHIPADTLLCAHHNVVPVTLIQKTGGEWTIENLLADLRGRDIWRLGGADAVIKKIEDQEAADDQQQRSSIWQDMYFRGRDAWRSYTARTGSRSNPGGTAAQAARRDTTGGAIQQP